MRCSTVAAPIAVPTVPRVSREGPAAAGTADDQPVAAASAAPAAAAVRPTAAVDTAVWSCSIVYPEGPVPTRWQHYEIVTVHDLAAELGRQIRSTATQ